MAVIPITGVSLLILDLSLLYALDVEPLLYNPLAKIPGPKAYTLTQ